MWIRDQELIVEWSVVCLHELLWTVVRVLPYKKGRFTLFLWMCQKTDTRIGVVTLPKWKQRCNLPMSTFLGTSLEWRWFPYSLPSIIPVPANKLTKRKAQECGLVPNTQCSHQPTNKVFIWAWIHDQCFYSGGTLTIVFQVGTRDKWHGFLWMRRLHPDLGWGIGLDSKELWHRILGLQMLDTDWRD